MENNISSNDSELNYLKLTLLFSRYEIVEFLEEGTYSKIFKAKDLKTNKFVAIKIFKHQNMDVDQVNREITIQRMLVHDNVIKLYDDIQTSNNKRVLVMEYASNGDLFGIIIDKKELSEDEARPFFKQLISGVEFCHENMVAHRDLKLDNLLLDENFNLKLADFGLSAIMNEDHLLRQRIGSLRYMAPEVLSASELDQPYLGPPADVWSCGVTLYIMLFGDYPFREEDAIKKGDYKKPQGVSSDVQDLIAGMLAVDPKLRLTIPEIRQHRWFQA